MKWIVVFLVLLPNLVFAQSINPNPDRGRTNPVNPDKGLVNPPNPDRSKIKVLRDDNPYGKNLKLNFPHRLVTVIKDGKNYYFYFSD